MSSRSKLLATCGGAPIDANFRNVTLLLHGDGSNGAQNNTFLDSSGNNFTITRTGNTTQGSFSPYGSSWSNYFDGSGDYLSIADNAAFDVGSGSFTIEAWIWNNGSTSASWIYGQNDVNFEAASCSVVLGVNSSNIVEGSVCVGTTFTSARSSVAIARSTWNHIAFVRDGATLRIFVNGVQTGTGNISTSTVNNSSNAIGIGRPGECDTQYFNGYISNFRFVKGTAVYTSNFTPPSAPLTAISGTSLLTCHSNRFRDASTNNFTITRNGNARVTNFGPFAPSAVYSAALNGGSAYFDGNGDYLSAGTNAAFAFGTGDFTIDFWAYFTNPSDDNGPIFDTRTASNNGVLVRQGNGAGGIANRVECNCAGTTAVSPNITFYSWTHVAVVRSSGSLKIYINGTGGSAVSATGNATGNNSYISAFFDGLTVNYDGYISNFRAVKGTAVYTANFTPPTAPVTAISGTSLLLNATNAAIFDNSAKNDLETVGNAQISTSVKKFGTGSMYFDGSGDWLQIPASPQLELSGDFTVEAWIYATAINTFGMILGSENGSSSDYLGISSSRVIMALSAPSGTGAFPEWSATFNTNQWYHVAVTRSGSTIRAFVNGTQLSLASGSATDSRQWFVSGVPLSVGRYGYTPAPYYFTGYIDDLRITKGIARYTANFTPPAAPFPDQ